MGKLGLVEFDDWTQGRSISSLGTNSGAPQLPFQGWHHFKEAFAPELVSRALSESEVEVNQCLDPFGGSGTTALACQFLGIRPVTIEVNPYLADLIEAKLSRYDVDALARDLRVILREASSNRVDARAALSALPRTFVEPGVKSRWIFNLEVANRIASLLIAINSLANISHRRFFKVLLGGILVGISNVVISGKGRRYRRGWAKREMGPQKVIDIFSDSVHRAIVEIRRYEGRAETGFCLKRGDCRTLLRKGMSADLVIFSPPYPNSFDYTDVYNIELWVLGYLSDSRGNRCLRDSTLCSHVQINRNFPTAPSGSPALSKTLDRLALARKELWSKWIPEMVGGYFADLWCVLRNIHRSLTIKGKVWMVVGDSQYAGVSIETSLILSQLSEKLGYSVEGVEPFRSMRSSAQQGGRPELSEALLMLKRC